MKQSLYFTSPGQVNIRSVSSQTLPSDHVLVQTRFSAISHGTEMLVFRGEAPKEMIADEAITALNGNLEYPLKYGYACVGEVIETGKSVDRAWIGRMVFAFNPHETRFCSRPKDLLPIPDDMTAEAALFLPNMETAIGVVMDGRPLIGERAAVFGLGIVGLLTTALLARHPLAKLVTTDSFALRRENALALGADVSLDAAAPNLEKQIREMLGPDDPGADLCFELSGNPEALDRAIAVAGYDGRVVIGSWYGSKRARLDLGGRFHREHIRLLSSQVSTISPRLRGRWDKNRRFDLAWDMIRATFQSVARYAIIPLQDVLSLGSDARMNFSGKAEGNW